MNSLVSLVGTLLVTIFGNVPLNDQLAAVSATDPDAVELWKHYFDRPRIPILSFPDNQFRFDGR
jgi:uncharacterized membrane protein